LEKWHFGEVESAFWDNWLWDLAKTYIIVFMEKMIYWKNWTKDSIFNSINPTRPFTLNPSEINNALEQNNIKSNLWFNINIMRKNLQKEVK
jgi:hypothetical protein